MIFMRAASCQTLAVFDGSLMLLLRPPRRVALSFSFWQMKLFWSFVDLRLHAGPPQKLDCNEVWNLDFGFKHWTTNHLFFFHLVIFATLFLDRAHKKCYFPSFYDYSFRQASTCSNHSLCDRFSSLLTVHLLACWAEIDLPLVAEICTAQHNLLSQQANTDLKKYLF